MTVRVSCAIYLIFTARRENWRSASHDDLALPLRLGLRSSLVRAMFVTWPVGDAPFAVDELVTAGRALDQAAREGLPVDVGRALEVVGTFPSRPSLLDRGQADGVGDRYVQMQNRGELSTWGDTQEVQVSVETGGNVRISLSIGIPR